MVRTISFILFCLISACTNYNSNLTEEEKLANQAIFDFGKKIQDKGFKLVGFGGAEHEGKTREFDISFYSDFDLTIPTARELIVELADDFLQDINNNQKLKPYLIEYPFTTAHIKICIFGDLKNNKNDFLYYVSMNNSHISYERDNPNGGLPITVLEETYDEALAKIKETIVLSNEKIKKPI